MIIAPIFQMGIIISHNNMIKSNNPTIIWQNINLNSAATLNGAEAQYLIITHDDFKDDIPF